MKHKKKLIIVGILIIIILSALISFYFFSKSRYAYKVEVVKDFNYNLISSEERYGVINRNGEIIVDPIYDIIQIPNPSKPVFICMYEYNVEQKEYKVKVLNDEKQELFTQYDSVQAIATEATEDGIPFEKSVLKYKKDGKYGLINLEGKEITKPIYDQINGINYKEGMLLVKLNEKCGVINIKGTVVIKPEYETITADHYFNKETRYTKAGFIVSKKTDEGYRYRLHWRKWKNRIKL